MEMWRLGLRDRLIRVEKMWRKNLREWNIANYSFHQTLRFSKAT